MTTKDFDITIENDIEQIQGVIEQLNAFGRVHKISPKIIYQLSLSIDEILTNIMSYGYEEEDREIDVRISFKDNSVNIQFSDDGKAFNPTEFSPPDMDTDLEERELGGLGIHLVKSMMDSIDYKREKNKNILILTKKVA
jgi:serine/threonine-protein kinase RsbW